MPLDSSVSYGGITGIRALRFPFGRGVTPSVACIYCVPQQIDPTGPLALNYNGGTIAIPDMAVASAHLRRRQDGRHPLMTVYLKDRRWRWAGKTVSGSWNRRTAAGLVDDATRKTPGELAGLILAALGEGAYDVSQMPTGVFPPAEWQNARADLALQKLCDYVACEVVLNPLTNTVAIVRLGVGSTTPTGVGEILPKFYFSPRSSVPASIRVLGGRAIFQSALRLRAVARNYGTGQVSLVDSVNFKPSAGWGNESIFSFPGVPLIARHLAFSDVWRLYQVVGQSNGDPQVPGIPIPITSMDQYHLNDFSLEQETDLSGFKRNTPGYVYVGEAWGYTTTATTGSNVVYLATFKILPERRSVLFDVPLFKLSTSGAFTEPTLYLNTSYTLTDSTGQYVGLYWDAAVGGSGGQLILNRPELFPNYDFNFSTNTQAETFQELSTYASLFQQKYASPWASEITYPGLVPGSPDGNLAQFTWEWSVVAPPVTTVCEGEELNPLAASAKRRRFDLQLEAMAQ